MSDNDKHNPRSAFIDAWQQWVRETGKQLVEAGDNFEEQTACLAELRRCHEVMRTLVGEPERERMTDTPEGFLKIGTVRIDTATLLLADFTHAAEAAEAFDHESEESADHVWQLGPALAIMPTGMGDGFYPVYVRYEEMQAGGQNLGRRIAEVRIVFWPHPAFSKSEE
jgi:hypothetical protein